MTHGYIDGLQVRIRITFRFVDKPDIVIEFVVDTGFEGALTLPSAAIEALGLPLFDTIKAHLADGSSVDTAVHIATILWDGQEHEVAVLAMGSRPLLGTALLAGKELVAQFVTDGLVTVDDVNAL
jgi:clan AA aspartic protease